MLTNTQNRAIVPGSLGAMARQNNQTLAESFLSVDAIIVVDMSGSMAAMDAPGGRSRYEAAEQELRDLQQQLPGKIAVVAFSSSVQFCPSGIPPRLGGGTALTAALRFVHPADGVARIIVISDGQPDSPGDALREARRFKHKIDTIYIGPEDGWGSGGQAFLQELAAATGGQNLQSAAPGLLKNETLKLLSAA